MIEVTVGNEFVITHDAPIEFPPASVGPTIARYLPGEIYRITDMNKDFVAYLCDNDAAALCDPGAPDSPLAVNAESGQAEGSVSTGEE